MCKSGIWQSQAKQSQWKKSSQAELSFRAVGLPSFDQKRDMFQKSGKAL